MIIGLTANNKKFEPNYNDVLMVHRPTNNCRRGLGFDYTIVYTQETVKCLTTLHRIIILDENLAYHRAIRSI